MRNFLIIAMVSVITFLGFGQSGAMAATSDYPLTTIYLKDVKSLEAQGYKFVQFKVSGKTTTQAYLFSDTKIENDQMYIKGWLYTYRYDTTLRAYTSLSKMGEMEEWVLNSAYKYAHKWPQDPSVLGSDVQNYPLKWTDEYENEVDDPNAGEDNSPTEGVTVEGLEEIPTVIMEHLKILIPVGLILLSVLLGISMIKRVIFSFL